MRLLYKIQLFATISSLSLWTLPLKAQLVWDGLPDAKFSVAVHGAFSNEASWDVNLSNATVGLSRPKDLNIDPSVLKVLNDSVAIIFDGILHGRQMFTSWKASDYKNWKKHAIRLFEPDSDRLFRIELRIDGDNGVGGNYGGLDMRLYFRSLHRQWDVVFGYAFRTLDHLGTPEESLASLKVHLKELLSDAIRDWKMSLKKELRYPVRYVIISFNTEELNRRQKAYVKKSLFPCLYQQTDSLGYVRLTDYDYQVFYRLGRNKEGETEKDYLRWYKDVLQFAMGTSGKYPCDLSRTPFSEFRPFVEANVEESKITIQWTKPK
ncbi:MAG: hypothetical protein KDC45_11535 [Bacteroidetes bacterium]|nr:hypothetical protein [Bacteroidota bacterium]